VGVGASRVRDLFEQAKAAAPAIIFIDEIDAVGRQRGAGLGGGHDEREQTLNQLLVEMDGFDDHQSVILIAATNRADILDPALLRPGRFDRQIMVMRPDLKGREEILKIHGAGKPLAHSVDLNELARMTPGFTGADLANLMNEAALLTARRHKKLITMGELNEAMEREIAGPERKSRIMTDTEKRTIAYHEAGHALVGHILEYSDPVHKISIISRGQALGYTLSLPTEDRFLSSRKEMLDDLAVFLGGRVSEELFCDDITTGASNDLERATKMARQMVTRYGMTEALGIQVYGEANHEVFLGRDYSATPDYSEETARRIDEEVSKIMRAAHDVAKGVLTSRSDQLKLMVDVLIERESVESEALEALLNNTWPEYLKNEDDILAKKADSLRKQEEEDARHAAEQQAAEEAAEKEAAALSATSGSAALKPGQLPSMREIVTGKVDLDDLMRRYTGENSKAAGTPPPAELQAPTGEPLQPNLPPTGQPLQPGVGVPPTGQPLPPPAGDPLVTPATTPESDDFTSQDVLDDFSLFDGAAESGSPSFDKSTGKQAPTTATLIADSEGELIPFTDALSPDEVIPFSEAAKPQESAHVHIEVEGLKQLEWSLDQLEGIDESDFENAAAGNSDSDKPES
jgi:ATP-dependent metalloprotease FtsH